MPQVHAEHAADLLQGAGPLRLVPARHLQEATAVRELQVGIRAGGGAGGAGRGMASCLSVLAAEGEGQGGHGQGGHGGAI